jgi:hypothetical protein
LDKFKTAILYLPLFLGLASTVLTVVGAFVSVYLFFVSLVITFVCGYFVFKDTMNVVQGIGPVYWITRDNGMDNQPIICVGFMRETGEPWRTGKGLQVRIKQYVFQLGLCRRNPNKEEEEGLLFAMKGRALDTQAKDIASW